MRQIGCHLSIAGGVHNAFQDMRELNINVFQIFLKSSSRWEDKEYEKSVVKKFVSERNAVPEIGVFAHSAYLINPAADDDLNKRRSLQALADELARAQTLGIHWIVVHPGSHKGTGISSGIERAVELIDAAFEESESEAGILLETTAGQGNAIGSRFSDIADIIQGSKYPEKLGVCLDTCHVFAAGYDFTSARGMKSMISEFDVLIGKDRLKLVHLNDSRNEAGSKKDRHDHIGKGKIGNDGIRRFLNERYFEKIPLILETPKEGDDRFASDRRNLEKVRELLNNE